MAEQGGLLLARERPLRYQRGWGPAGRLPKAIRLGQHVPLVRLHGLGQLLLLGKPKVVQCPGALDPVLDHSRPNSRLHSDELWALAGFIDQPPPALRLCPARAMP